MTNEINKLTAGEPGVDKPGLKKPLSGGYKRFGVMLLLTLSLLITGCSGNVGIGMSVGVPVGNHGYMSVGGTRWH